MAKSAPEKKAGPAAKPSTKEGLDAALDATKVIITLAGGGIAFVLDKSQMPTPYPLWEKIIDFSGVVLFALSMLSGLLVLTRGAKQHGVSDFTLTNGVIGTLGFVNFFAFALATLLVAVRVSARIWGWW
ncbi:MAG TPA: hypothetical protein VNU97_13170 [Rhizomicrobium sp.]|jgi:hypothetical protein|nr:hypothetical protein [Rhizomicrobium sp.]